MKLVSAAVENELSDAQMEAAAVINANITTGVIWVPTIVYEAPELVIDKDIGIEGEITL